MKRTRKGEATAAATTESSTAPEKRVGLSKKRTTGLYDFSLGGQAPSAEEAALRKANLAEESDSSDDEGGMRNRIGNVPLEWYKDYEHIGYDVYGKKIAKPEWGDSLDQLLARADDPNFQWTVTDHLNGVQVVLSPEERQLLQRIRKGKLPFKQSEQFDPFAEFDEVWAGMKEKEAFGNPQAPKRRFVPSKIEERHVVRLVNALRNGWIKPSWEREEERKRAEEKEETAYLLWADDGSAIDRDTKRIPPVPPPKPKLPGHAESFNPPEEYLMTEEEKAQWEAMDPEDRPHNFIPEKFAALRAVPAYANAVKERFERCLDLYLCPREVKRKMNVDPESLIPKLPKPDELRPFPTMLSVEYRGHTARIRSITPSPCGQWIASGADDGTVRIWEVETGRCFRKWDFRRYAYMADGKKAVTQEDKAASVGGQGDEVVDSVAWNPNPDFPLIAVCIATKVLLLPTHTGSSEQMASIEALLNAPPEPVPVQQHESRRYQKLMKTVNWGVTPTVDSAESTDPNAAEVKQRQAEIDAPVLEAQQQQQEKEEEGQEGEATAAAAAKDLEEVTAAQGVKWSRLSVDIGRRARQVVWHKKGDYFATFSPEATSMSVLIHRLTKSRTQTPFGKSKGLVQAVTFHPTKPFFLVATQRHVRIYNLAAEQLVKKLLSPAKWISSIDVHPGGDHVLVGSYDRKVSWYDLDLASTPFKTLKYHTKAVRSVAFHSRYPLFASASDDGKVHVFHGQVFNDLVTNPRIVPVKVLHAMGPRPAPPPNADPEMSLLDSELGVLDCKFHPTQPWLFSSGADHVIRLFST